MRKNGWREAFIAIMVTIGLIAAGSVIAWAAGSVTVTDIDSRDDMNIFKVTWVADNATSVVPYVNLDNVRGFIYHVITDPGATSPTDDYDIYLRDYASGVSMLGTTLENRDEANSELVTPSVPVYMRSLGFSLSGTAKSDATGDVYIFTSPNAER